MPRRAMSSVKEVSRDSGCSTRLTRGATKVPEPCRCTRYAAADQILHRLAHGDARHIGLDRDVAFGRQRVAGTDDAGIDGVLDALLELQVERRALLWCVAHVPKDLLGGVSHRCLRFAEHSHRHRRPRRRAHPDAGLSASPVLRRKPRRVERRQPAEQAERRLAVEVERAERGLDRRYRARKDRLGHRSPFAAWSNTLGAKPP